MTMIAAHLRAGTEFDRKVAVLNEARVVPASTEIVKRSPHRRGRGFPTDFPVVEFGADR
jgi:hypothetical protein